MKPFHETSELRWKAMQRDISKDSGGRTRLEEIQFSLDGRDNAPTNSCWEYLTIMLPQLVWTNPSLSVESRVPGMAQYDALGLRYALESLMETQRWNTIWEQVFTDALAWRGVTMVTSEDCAAPRYMDGLNLIDWEGKRRPVEAGEMLVAPRLVYIHPSDFFIDSDVRTTDAARRMGHKWKDSRNRLKRVATEDDSYNLEALRSFSGSSTTTDDDLITVHQMYVPNYIDPDALGSYDGDEKPGDDDLHFGTLYTMVENSGGGTDLRKPRVYRGPAMGPYQVYECVPEPGRRSRKAPLAASWPQIDRDARFGEALIKSCESYKRNVLATEEVADALYNDEMDGIVKVGLGGELLQMAVKEIEIGGPSGQMVSAYGLSRDAVDKTLGMSDTLRGVATRGTTATAESIADKSTGVKTALLRNSLQRAAERQIYVAAWQIMHSPDFIIALPDAARQSGLEMMRDAGLPIGDELLKPQDGEVVIFTGGDSLKTGPRNAFDGLMVRIEAMSMERTSEALQQKRVFESVEMIGKLLEMQQMFPDFDAKGAADDISGKLNMPGLGKHMPGTDAVAQQMAMQQQAGMQPAAGGPVGPQAGAMAAGGAL